MLTFDSMYSLLSASPEEKRRFTLRCHFPTNATHASATRTTSSSTFSATLTVQQKISISRFFTIIRTHNSIRGFFPKNHSTNSTSSWLRDATHPLQNAVRNAFGIPLSLYPIGKGYCSRALAVPRYPHILVIHRFAHPFRFMLYNPRQALPFGHYGLVLHGTLAQTPPFSTFAPDCCWSSRGSIESLPQSATSSATLEYPNALAHNGDVRDKVRISSDGVSYTFQHQLGNGSFGRVVLATCDSGARVAIKVINKDDNTVSTGPPNRDWTWKFARMVQREIDALRSITLARSPFLANLLHSFRDEHNIYLVMPLYRIDLARIFEHMKETNSYFPAEDIRIYAAQLITGLEVLHHEHHVVHRDIKPSNILMDEYGTLAFTDFGLSEKSEREIAQGKADKMDVFVVKGVVGTRSYSSPEMQAGVKSSFVGVACDVWALGCVLYELFTHGRKIFLCRDEDYDSVIHSARVEELAVEADAKDLLKALLHPKACHRRSVRAFRNKIYFSDLDWDAIRSGAMYPSWLPPYPNAIESSPCNLFSNWNKAFAPDSESCSRDVADDGDEADVTGRNSFNDSKEFRSQRHGTPEWVWDVRRSVDRIAGEIEFKAPSSIASKLGLHFDELLDS